MITISTRNYTTEQLKHIVSGLCLTQEKILKAQNVNTWKRAHLFVNPMLYVQT